MSDASEIDKKVQAIQNFMGANTKAECPICGQNHFGILGGSDSPSWMMVKNSMGVGIKIYAVVCLHCGYIRQHAAAVVDDKIKKGLPASAGAASDDVFAIPLRD